MKTLALTMAGALLGCPAAVGTILLNEVHLNVPGSDQNYEFIELKSTNTIPDGVESCAGHWIVIINNDRRDADTLELLNVGLVRQLWSLEEFSTGPNGLLLLGNDYVGNPRGGPWSGSVDPQTNVGDPPGMGDSNIGSNDGLTILLVSGLSSRTFTDGIDVDVNDNRIFDWEEIPVPPGAQVSVMPWASIVDSIGTRDRGEDNGNAICDPYVPPAANIRIQWGGSSLGNRDPDTMARQLGNDPASTAAAWYGGKLAGSLSTGISYVTNRRFGPGNMLGEVTPGRPNLSADLPATSFRISEVGLNPAGQNVDRFQYIEIVNTSNTARSLNGYWLVLIDSFDGGPNDEEPNVGRIIEKWDLSSMATGGNGLLMIGNDFSPGYNPFGDLTSPLTGFVDPEPRAAVPASGIQASTGMSEGDIGFKDGFTLVLVQNFIAPAIDDLDPNDDGVLDTPLSSLGIVVDQVGFSQINAVTRGRTYASVDLRSEMNASMVPDNMSRKPGDISVTTAAWYGGSYPGGTPGFNVAFDPTKATGAGIPYDPWFGGFRAAGTPGLPNLPGPIDPTAPPVPSTIRINEVMINPTNISALSGDGNREYIELINTTESMGYLDGLWIVIVNLAAQGANPGAVVESFRLDGNTTGLNGITVLADNYDNPDNHPYRFVDGNLTPFCAAFDPADALAGSDLPNDGLCILILRGPKLQPNGPFTVLADGSLSGDLVLGTDGVMLAPSTIADEVVDSIAVADQDPGPGYGWINGLTPFKPSHIARYPGEYAASNGNSYYYGEIPEGPASNPAIEYTTNFSGRFKGAASLGRPNHGAPTGSSAIGAVVLNEIDLNPPGADNNNEFVELLDTAGGVRSLNHYYLLMVDNVPSNTGSIRAAWSLDGMSTGPNGLFVMGNRYPLPGIDNNPWSAVMRSATRVGDPPGRDGLITSLSDGSLGDETDNLSVMFLLVRDFSAYVNFDIDAKQPDGPDLDTAPDDSDGDGVIDGIVWSDEGPHDSLIFRDYVPVTPPPPTPPPFEGFTYGLADLTQTWFPMTAANGNIPVDYYHPETFARFLGEKTPNNAGAWYGGDLDGGASGNDGQGSFYFRDATHEPKPNGFTGHLTPGQPNLARIPLADPDNDGVLTLIEQAVGSDPLTAGPVPLPEPGVTGGTLSDSGKFSFRRIKGGTLAADGSYSVEAFRYVVGTSSDLTNWTWDGTTVQLSGTPVDDGNGITETVTYRMIPIVSSPPGRSYFLLKVERRVMPPP